MLFILGLVIGIAIGAGVVYALLQGTIGRQKQELAEKQRTIEDLERSRESRLRETVQSLQTDYRQQLDEQMQAANQRHEAQIESLKSAHAQELEAQAQAHAAQLEASQRAHEAESQVTPAAHGQVSPPEAPLPLFPEASEPADLDQSPSPAPPPQEPLPPPTQLSEADAEVIQARAVTPLAIAPLLAKITTLGHIARPSAIPELSRYARHASVDVRAAVAEAFGQINATHASAPSVRDTIAPLTELSRDADPTVRRLAIQALGQVPSPQVLPIVRRALRDASPQVVKAATAQMERLKLYRPASPPRKKSFKPPQPRA